MEYTNKDKVTPKFGENVPFNGVLGF
jgi:hypothetical protein